MGQLLETSQTGRVLRVELNRPEKRNALNVEMCRDLVDTLGHADRNPRVGAILLTGRGEAFCAGMDLQEAAEARVQKINYVHEQLFTLTSRMGKPIVAGVRGAALGGGTGLVANCHYVVAADNAVFGLTEIRLGLWPFLVYRAVELALGERRTVALALTGQPFGAAEAVAMGLAQEVAADPEARAMKVATAMAEASPSAIRAGLTFVQEVRGKDWEVAGLIAHRVRDEVFQSADFREGLAAFREKRKPTWPSIGEFEEESGGEPQ